MQIEEAKEIMNNFIKDTPKMPYECLMNKEVEAVETLLNYVDTMHKEFERLEGIEDNTAMLKKELEGKDQIIEQLKSINKFQSRDITEAVNYTFELNKELEKAEEVINEMAKYIKEPYQIIAFGSRKQKIEIIKEYFYKKVEKN